MPVTLRLILVGNQIHCFCDNRTRYLVAGLNLAQRITTKYLKSDALAASVHEGNKGVILRTNTLSLLQRPQVSRRGGFPASHDLHGGVCQIIGLTLVALRRIF